MFSKKSPFCRKLGLFSHRFLADIITFHLYFIFLTKIEPVTFFRLFEIVTIYRQALLLWRREGRSLHCQFLEQCTRYVKLPSCLLVSHLFIFPLFNLLLFSLGLLFLIGWQKIGVEVNTSWKCVFLINNFSVYTCLMRIEQCRIYNSRRWVDKNKCLTSYRLIYLSRR